jgi:formate C-acetyltransferase
MNERTQRLKDRLNVDRYPICVERIGLITESLKQTDGEPQILRSAKSLAHFLDHKTLFIEDDELIVGNVACKPMGMEAGAPTWSAEDLKELKEGKERFFLTDEDEALLRTMDDYWKGKGRLIPERQGQLYDDERLWPFIQSGVLCPPWKEKDTGRGFGRAGGRLGRFRGPRSGCPGLWQGPERGAQCNH